MTNGAAQDIQDATGVARNMVVLYGMSERVRHDGPGLPPQPVPGRRLRHGLRPGHRRGGGPGGEASCCTQCYEKAVEVIRENREDMDKVVAYLLEKETITGAEMVAILEGRDPALADVTPEDRERQGIEAPARHISMVSQKIEAPEEAPQAAGEGGETQTAPASDASAPDSGTGEEGSAPPPSNP